MASSYYSLLFLVDVEVADSNSSSDNEIIEFSWMAYDAEQGCATEQACYYIHSDESSEDKLKHLNMMNESVTLAEAIKQFDSVIFAAMQKSRKPMSLAAFNASRFYSILSKDALKKEITLYPHYSHCIDIVQLIREIFPDVYEDDLRQLRKAAVQMGVTPGVRESGLDNCQTLSGILSRLFIHGLTLKKEHSIFVTDDNTTTVSASNRHTAIPRTSNYSSSLVGSVSGSVGDSSATQGEVGAYIRLRGLPWGVEVSQIVDFIRSVCQISNDDVKIIVGYDGRANGEAYVVMPSIACRDAAIKDLNRKSIGRRWVEIFKASEDEFKKVVSKQKALLGGYNSMGEAVLRLRGLPWSCNEYEIVKFFKDGNFNINAVDVVMGYASDNRLSGEAWVVMDSREKAEAARFALHEKGMGRRYIEVFPSTIEDMNQAKMYKSGQLSYPMRGNTYSRASNDANYGFSIIRLRGLPYHANETHIVNFFSGYHMTLILPTTAPVNGKPSGEAYVRFFDADEAWKAYKSKNRQFIEHRYIELFPATQQEMDFAAQGGDPRTVREPGRPY